MKKSVILVPTDFTSVADNAIQHALTVARTAGLDLTLLHVVAKKEQVESAKEKLDLIAQKITGSRKVNTEGIVRIGNIFEDIGETASEIGAKLIFMGTHGAKGMQKILGSYALRVITNSNVPFIVVQEKAPSGSGYKNIVLPMDISKETKYKMKVAIEIAKYFDSMIHIVMPRETDEFLKNQLNRNIVFAKKHLKENGISFTTNIAESNGSFVKEVIRFAGKINADLISIVNLHEGTLTPILGKNEEQALITNDAQIPVMCVTPSSLTVSGNILFT